jgi:hypothetical protein
MELPKRITKALIIDEPWISRIIHGEKGWEMRSTNSRIRGPIGLIRKGSLQVVGIANFNNVLGPYDNEQLIENSHHHTIPNERFNAPDYKWRYAWELLDAKPLSHPVSYQHKNGAVIWVELDDDVIEKIEHQLSGELTEPYLAEVDKAQPGMVTTHHDLIWLPMAKDGSVFSEETCSPGGIYTVGNKGEEVKFNNFFDALNYLKQMPKARWRRANSAGNFGIVTAVDWVSRSDAKHLEKDVL